MLAIAAAYVDYALEMVIKDEDGRMFDGAQNAFLATASSKIAIAYARPICRKAVAGCFADHQQGPKYLRPLYAPD
ncbi:hypothetical protein [Bradyrhizobium arachidis]|uniref:hypothetical protein n=1 Tax=Bradyrhizobium arachidis TaxID=858423 RepID=UPI0021638F75|nr:hypothetical protein [Bradyrhizobium arachidis]UVO28130.1 hypothetical protein KUF59_37605 [Bradyrhizobium arachidis]